MQEGAEDVFGNELFERVPRHDLETEGVSSRLQHSQRLRVAIGVDEEAIGLSLGDPLGHGHGLGGGGRLIQERGVGKFKAGQITDRLLKVQKDFQPSLADFRLVGRISRVPGGNQPGFSRTFRKMTVGVIVS